VRQDQALKDLFAGKPTRHAEQVPGVLEGRILSIAGNKASFTIPEWDASKRFSPAPFITTNDPPAPGDRCLVAFVGSGIDRPWILSWSST
jgi:hypothetical protein